LVVHAESGLDEIALQGSTTVAEVTGDAVRIFELATSSFGLGESSHFDIRSTDSAHSASVIRNVLLGKPHDQTVEDIVVINAAAALFVSAAAGSLTEGVALARQSLRDGNAHKKLEELASAVPA
jgi:anthranilate phosphoribosyltransferase